MAATKAQHLTALQSANTVRLARAALRRKVREGELSVADVLSPDHVAGVRHLEPVAPVVESLPVHTLLTWAPRWADLRARKLLEGLRIGEQVPVGALTDRQRWKIVAALIGEEDPFTRDVSPLQRAIDEARAMTAAKSTARPQLPPHAPIPARLPDDTPPVLRVECPHCGANPGQPCASYDPVRDHWHEPSKPHGPRVKAAARRA